MGNLVHAVLRSSVPDLQQARNLERERRVHLSGALSHHPRKRQEKRLCALPSQELKGEEPERRRSASVPLKPCIRPSLLGPAA